ncbi:MAG: hypothetical protein C0451_05715 [Comamonadaceae bacterium]|nr:hypothetical protein [Comamonadaceae bacterium]
MLRPLVRLMVARGITYPYLADLLKGLFVEVADADFRIDGQAPTDSRVSLLSGVHRKDVSRLRGLDPAAAVPAPVPLTAQVYARWVGDPAWRNRRGQPLPLPRLASGGGDRSFEALVSGISTDIRPRVLLDEWLDRGLVVLDEQDRVCLQTQALVPSAADDEKLHYFVHQMHDHAAAATHNLLGGAPHFDRCVHADGLTAADVEVLRQLAQAQGMQALLVLNDEVQRLQAAHGADSPPADERFTLGVYFYSEAVKPETDGADR